MNKGSDPFISARLRGDDPTEVQLAAEIFGGVLGAEKINEPDPGSILSLDRAKAKTHPFIFSVTPRPTPEETDGPMAALGMAMDADKRVKAHRRAAEAAVARIREAPASGANRYLVEMDAEDFKPVLSHAPDMVDRWLEGFAELTTDFRRRVHLAEAAFLALCEALLACDPVRGTQLWHALRATVTTQYMGAAGVEDLLHMVFRVPASPAVTALRDELLGLAYTHNDFSLFDLAVAACYNGQDEWLRAVIEEDRASSLAWRRKRGEVLAGFTTKNTLPVEGAWPAGETRTGYAELNRKSARFRWVEACARHWWRSYLSAPDATEAYAAWVLYVRSADRRAWLWMNEDAQAADNASDFFKLKLSHSNLNRSKLQRAMEERAKDLSETFPGRKVSVGIGPWG